MKINPLIGQVVDTIVKLNAQLAKLAPCSTCDGSGFAHDGRRYDPCCTCWGKGWDLDNLTEDDGNAGN
jgi:DnaJ-class molecular chaperone